MADRGQSREKAAAGFGKPCSAAHDPPESAQNKTRTRQVKNVWTQLVDDHKKHEPRSAAFDSGRKRLSAPAGEEGKHQPDKHKGDKGLDGMGCIHDEQE
jgi:hypothetical protein